MNKTEKIIFQSLAHTFMIKYLVTPEKFSIMLIYYYTIGEYMCNNVYVNVC